VPDRWRTSPRFASRGLCDGEPVCQSARECACLCHAAGSSRRWARHRRQLSPHATVSDRPRSSSRSGEAIWRVIGASTSHLSARRFPGAHNLVVGRVAIDTLWPLAGRLDRHSYLNRKAAAMGTFLWILLSVFYIVLLITLGVATLRKGHYALFIIGIFFPVLWLIGALIGPTPRAAEAH
jgi:hypothetical protein